MRLDTLIILRIEWNSYELISRGKQMKYWRTKLGKQVNTCLNTGNPQNVYGHKVMPGYTSENWIHGGQTNQNIYCVKNQSVYPGMPR